MKKLSLILLALSFGACSSAPTTARQASSPRPDSEFDAMLKTGERTPSNVNGDPSLSWETPPIQFNVGPQGADTMLPTVQVTEYQVQQVPVLDTGCTVDREVEVAGQYPSYQNCTDTPSDAPAWAAFDQAQTTDQKIRGLASAIKGVGVKSATALINNGYFQARPKSWTAFQTELQNASDHGVIQKGVFTQTTVGQYAADNRLSLGYGSPQTTATCQPVMVPSTYWVIKSFPVDCTTSHYEPKKVAIDQQFLHVHVVVRSPMLQSFETDTVNMQLGHNGEIISLDAGPYTSYYKPDWKVLDNNVTITLQGRARNTVALPTDVIQGVSLEARGSQKVEFVLKVNPQYIPKSASDELRVRYSVNTCDVGQWFGTCRITSWVKGDIVEAAINQSTNPFSAVINAPNSKKVQVSYQVYRHNSLLYNSDPYPATLTDATNQAVRPNK